MSERALVTQAQVPLPSHATGLPARDREDAFESENRVGKTKSPDATFGHNFLDVVCAPPLRVSERSDPTEREADRVADALTGRRPLARSAISTSLTRQETARTIQPHARNASPGFVPSTTTGRLTGGARPGGEGLDRATRAEFEPLLGRDLKDVRLHTDAAAASDASAINARAFTHGQDIFFGTGAYQPQTATGRWLLAHEVTHTQQAAPGIISRLVAGAAIPAPPEMGAEEEAGAGSESPGSAAEEINNTLETDPEDKSGRAAGSFAKLPPKKRQQAGSIARNKKKEAKGRDDTEVVSRPPPALPRDTTRTSTDRAPGAASRHPPGSREDQARQSPATTVSPRVPQKPAGPTTTPAGITPRVPPSLTRTSPERKPPSQLSTSPPKQQPDAGTEASDEAKGAKTQGGAGAKGTGASDADAPAADGKGSAADENEDGQLRLSDLLEPSNQPAGVNGAQATMASSDRPQQKMAENDSAVSDVLNSSNGGEEGGFGATQTLALPLAVAEDTVSEEVAQEEPRSDAESAAEMEGYASQLETALAGASETLEAKAGSVRTAVRQSAASARAGIRATVERTVTSIQAGGNALLGELARGVTAAKGVIKGCLSARSAEATGKGTASQKTINGIFSGHRKTVDGTVKTAVEDAEKLRTKKVESAKKRNQADIKSAYARGGAKMRSFPATNRGAFVGGAAFDVAEGTAKEMAGQEPDIVAAINEVTAPLPEHFRAQGVEALNGFDQNLPDIIASVVTGTEQTDGELTKSAADAYKQLDQFAVDTEADITGLMEDAITQARAILPPAEQQLDQALGTILRTIAAAPKEVSTRVTPPIEEAISLFRGGEDADIESAPQLTETLLAFLNESVASTSAKLDQAGTAGKARFQSMSGSTRHAMRALQSRTDATWKVARAGMSSTLMRLIAGADAALGGIVKTFGDALGETEQSIRDELSPVVTDLKGSFDQSLKDAEVDIDSRISDGLSKNTEALGSLDAKMQEAVDEAAWEWDHPVLSALSFIAGILVGIIKVLALVLLLIVVVIVLAKVLAVSALVAGIILLVGMVAFSIGYAFGARLAAGQGVGEAFGGAVMDFGRAAPGMLYDMTGIPKLKRAFSDERMTPYERGKLVGEGGTELVLAIFMVRGAAKGIAKGFRKLPRIPWRRPVRVEPRIGFGGTPKARPPGVKPAPEPTIGFGRQPKGKLPGAAPKPEPTIGFGAKPKAKVPGAEPTPEPTIGFGRAPKAKVPGAEPTPEPTIGFGRSPKAKVPGAEPTPEPTIGFGRAPRPKPSGGTGTASGPGVSSPKSMQAPEPITIEPQPKAGVGATMEAGGSRPGGTASAEPRASLEPPGETGGPRPGRTTAAGEGSSPSGGAKGPRPVRSGQKSVAEVGETTPQKAGESVTPGESTAKPAETGAEVKAEPAKTGKSSAPKKQPRAPRKKATPEQKARTKARKELSELQKQKAASEAEKKAYQAERDRLFREHNEAVARRRAAMEEAGKAATQAEKDAALAKAKAAVQDIDAVAKAKSELPETAEGFTKEIEALEKKIAKIEPLANPKSRGALPCFSGDTLVSTPDGPRAIADLHPGDEIWSFDFSTGTRKARPILQLHRGKTLAFQSVLTTQGTVRATSQHRFWVETDAAWRPADCLTPGMWLRDLEGNKLEILGTKKEEAQESETFNLSVEEYQTYFVGPGVLVHNQAVDIGLGSEFIIYRGTNPKYPGKVYIGQVTELDAKGKPRGTPVREIEHQEFARNKLKLDAEGIEKLSAKDRAFYEFMKDVKLEPQVKGIATQAQADYLEQHNINIERRLVGKGNVMNRRNQITSAAHLKEVIKKIMADAKVKAKGFCL